MNGMAGGTLKYEDEDDWGTPLKRRNTPSLTRQIRRLRTPILVAVLILSILYWLRSDGQNTASGDFSAFAYVQYATDPHSLCNSFMVFESLKRLGSRADRVLLYPEEWSARKDDPDDRNSQLLVRAKKLYGVKLKPTQLLGLDGPASAGTLRKPSNWETSMTKLRVFELDEYERVIYFDSDVHLQQHMDELFTLPRAAMAMPRAYWSPRRDDNLPMSSALMLFEPNPAETKKMWDRLQEWRLNPDRGDSQHYDDDLINERFAPSAMVLPHRPYLLHTGNYDKLDTMDGMNTELTRLFTGEFRRDDHERWLGTVNGPEDATKWDPFVAVKEAKLVHFNDWPLPKPWIMWPIEGLAEVQPDCGGSHTGTCGDREVWKGLYDEFRFRRKDLCKILSVPVSSI